MNTKTVAAFCAGIAMLAASAALAEEAAGPTVGPRAEPTDETAATGQPEATPQPVEDEPGTTSPTYTVAPLPPPDPRNTYVPPQGAVFVIDQRAGKITLCYPDAKDSSFIVTCTTPTTLFP